LAAGAALVSSQSDPWSDLESCHKPTDEGCESCCDSTSKGTVVRTWTGNCTGCVPGAPCEPGNCPCGNCFPGAQPWWNEESFLQPGQEPPKGCKPCSKCTRRIIGDFIQTMFDTPQDGPCKCPDPEATPPGDGDCSCGAPGVACCDCQCQYKGDMQVYCGLDPTPATFPGPCAFDKLYNTSRGDPFTAKCDSKGYYDIIDCGPVAPPPLPPSPPEARAEMRRQAAAHPVVHHRRVLDEAPPGSGFCWCVEPTYGIQNGTSAVHAGADPPNCHPTVQCGLLNKPTCVATAQFCNWTYIPFDKGYECVNLRPN